MVGFLGRDDWVRIFDKARRPLLLPPHHLQCQYNFNSMTYVETLYDHQSPVVDVSCANNTRPVK